MNEARRQITQFPKNSYKNVVFSTNEFKGKTYLDMRLWGKSDNGEGQNILTKKGLTLAVDRHEVSGR
jgi:hypothetical protein